MIKRQVINNCQSVYRKLQNTGNKQPTTYDE